MELSTLAPLVGIGVAFAGGLSYITAAAVVRVSRSIDAALAEFGGDDDE